MIAVMGLVLLALAALPAALAVANLRLLYATHPHPPRPGTVVSILIPARNEAMNIGPALEAALASTGVPVEVLVMDDGSIDGTAAVAESFSARDDRVSVLFAPPLAEGWTGKIHACHHLSLAARGTHFLFVDADVRLAPDAASRLAGRAQACGARLVSAVPRQIMVSPGEMLTVPMINLVLLGYLPMSLMRVSGDPGLGAACGQMMLVEAESYREAGGHGAIRGLLHDGLQLARVFRRNGHRTDLVFGHDLAACRMYAGLREAWTGFAKNAHEGMATPIALPVWTALLAGGHVLPFVILPFAPTAPVALATLLSLATRAIITLSTREPLLTVACHPVTVATALLIQWSTLLRMRTGRLARWKGRLYPVG